MTCRHCGSGMGWRLYAAHVKLCIAEKMRAWDHAAYSEKYFKQVRATSRYRKAGDPRLHATRSKSWGWWLVKPDGLPIQSLLPRR